MTGTAGAGEQGSSCQRQVRPSSATGVSEVEGQEPGTAESSEAAVDSGSGGEGGDVGGCWCCCVGDDGRVRVAWVVPAVRAAEVRALAMS